MNALRLVWDRFEEGFIVFLLAAMTLVTFVYVILNNLYTLFYNLGDRFAAAGDFFASISGATFQYFVQDAAGTFSYNGQAYKTLAQYDPSKSISVSTVGANGGQVMQLVVVPEPGAIVLAGVGAAIAAWACRRGKMPPR